MVRNLSITITGSQINFFFSFFSGYQSHYPPKIVEHPKDTIVPRHEPATLNCKASSSPEASVLWYRDGQVVRTAPSDQRSHRVLLPDGSLFFLRTVAGRKDSDSGVYFCEAFNGLGRSRSRNATLLVAVLKDEFRIEPQNVRIATGDTAILECGPPKGIPEPTVFWKKNNQVLDLDANRRIRIVDGGNLAITDVRKSDDGRYQCVAKNVAGIRESAVAQLRVHTKPFLIQGPSNITALIGSTVEFSCQVGGDPLPDVLWKRSASGGNMPLGRVHVLEDRSLRLQHATVEDIGTYTCEADNAVGSVVASGYLNVESYPQFLIKPQNISRALENDSRIQIECKGEGHPDPFLFFNIEGQKEIYFFDPKSETNTFQSSLQDEKNRVRRSQKSFDDEKLPYAVQDVQNKSEINLSIEKSSFDNRNSSNVDQSDSSIEKSTFVSQNENNRGKREKFNKARQFEKLTNVVQNDFSIYKSKTGSFLIEFSTNANLDGKILICNLVNGAGGQSAKTKIEIFENENTNFTPVVNIGFSNLTFLSAVTLTDVIPVTSQVVKVYFDIDRNAKKYLESLTVYYLSIFDRYSYAVVTDFDNFLTVSNLQKFTKYDFFAIPNFKNFDGKPSNLKSCTTLQDVPSEAPTHMEAALLNSTSVHIKWLSPSLKSLNGHLKNYLLILKNNHTGKSINHTTTESRITLTNLQAGIKYTVKVAACTVVGHGPFGPEATLRLDPTKRILDQHLNRQPIGPDIYPGDFITETWFVVLLISMVFVMILLFGAMFFVRRRQLLRCEKTMTPPSRSNGGVLSTPIGFKHDAPLWLDKQPLPEYSSTLPEYAKLTSQEYLRIPTTDYNPLDFNRSLPDKTELATKNYQIKNDFNSMQIQEYAHPNIHNGLADYAEVAQHQNRTVLEKSSSSNSPEPYATTTLVTQNRRYGNSLNILQNWMPRRKFPENTSPEEETMYPSLNGGYYNRNVYSDTYHSTENQMGEGNIRINQLADHLTEREGRITEGNYRSFGEDTSPSELNEGNNLRTYEENRRLKLDKSKRNLGRKIDENIIYARVGPPTSSWMGGSCGASPNLSSFSSHSKHVYHSSAKSEPGSQL